MIGLTRRQREILEFIIRFRDESGFPPTLREIGPRFGIKSTNGVNDHLAALERKGYIARTRDAARGIKILRDPREAQPHECVSLQ